MEKIYDPKQIETKWQQKWQADNRFVTPLNADGAPHFCIMLPPPNVTGSLHMGHAFQDTLMDLLIRYHKSLGYNTLWQGGTDHAGIATQMVVERQLAAQNITKHDLGRKEFINKVWDWKQESGNTIQGQLQRLGTSIDWDRSCFTMDEDLSRAVIKVFVELYRDGLIYQSQKLVNWDTALGTAISDLEVEQVEEAGFLWYVDYKLQDSDAQITIATTRPETILGDVAIAVNPDDVRYKHLIGKFAVVPIVGRSIPIIADDYVSSEFGTGCVKITPAHDFNDYAIAKRHNLPMISIMDLKGKINENAPQSYFGLDRADARIKIVAELKDLNLLNKIEPHTLMLPKGDRSKTIIEPMLTKQWFVSTKDLAADAYNKVASGEIKFVPENWTKTYNEWMLNIEDWCISRQLWWGHQIPAWQDLDGNVYVGYDELDVRKHYNLSSSIELTQDADVLDTWFSSALWPFTTLGWPHNTYEMNHFFPTSVLVTGFDIIFFWVARMIMMSLHFTKKIPFHTVYIHGLILDNDGQKMSKTKGNVIDPLDIVDGIDLESLCIKRTSGLMQPEQKNKILAKTKQQFPQGINPYGTDALRLTFCLSATPARHIRFDFTRLETSRNFCNKLWNAARFALSSIPENLELKATFINSDFDLSNSDLSTKWIVSLWQEIKQQVQTHLANYRFDLASELLIDFVWYKYCDWYIEISKSLMQQHNPENVANVLLGLLIEILAVLHPMIPFITEEIYAFIALKYCKSKQYLIELQFPVVVNDFIDQNAMSTWQQLQEIIIAIRNMRAAYNIKPKVTIELLVECVDLTAKKLISDNLELVYSLAKVHSIKFVDNFNKQQTASFATAVTPYASLYFALDLFIDPIVEKERLTKELQKVNKELSILRGKLDNTSYLSKAPKDVVIKDTERKQQLELLLQELQGSYEQLV